MDEEVPLLPDISPVDIVLRLDAEIRTLRASVAAGNDRLEEISTLEELNSQRTKIVEGLNDQDRAELKRIKEII